jgi:hypothetical protein
MDIIGRTIRDQIKAIDFWALAAYAATGFKSLEETENREGGLSFQVSGRHFIGKVMIELTWMDEYRISFVRGDETVEKMIDHVYCDQLVDVLNYIEKGD